MQDNFSTDKGVGDGEMVQAVMRSMASNGECQMKLHSLAHRSPPAVWLGSCEAPTPVARGLGTPVLIDTDISE